MTRDRDFGWRLARTAMLIGAIALLPAMFARTAPAQTAPADLIAAMQAGGKVIFLRHAITDPNQIDSGILGTRSMQRNLTGEGIRQAQDLGEATRTLGIIFDRILASPVFRARDTAEIAFGRDAIEVTMDIVADDYAGRNVGAMIRATRRLLATEPPPGTNLLLVGHRTPLQMATGQSFPDTVLPEGAMAIFQPGGVAANQIIGRAAPGGDTFELIGTLSAAELISAAEDG